MSDPRPSCSLAAGLDPVPWRALLKDRALHLLIPPARALVRYAPPGVRRERLWKDRVEPYLGWHEHRFAARTVFGCWMRGDTQEVLQQHVYYFGVWEPNLTAWLTQRLQPGATMIDVGANIGYFTLLAARRVAERGHVLAVEASPAVYRRLQANLSRNRVGNVRAVNMVAAREHGERTVYRGPASHTGLTTIDPRAGLPAEDTVAAASLPQIAGPRTWEAARVIKIDVEGAEDEVVAGLAGALDRCREDVELVVELHPGSDRSLFDRLERAGFHPYGLEIDYSPLSYRRRPPRPAPRLTELPDRELDIVFSRHDGSELR